MVRVLFVCLGNICRSPLGEGVMRHVVEQAGLGDRIEVDSAGTGAWHAGEAPDPRSVAIAAHHGVSLAGQKARQVCDADYEDFDLILAMDSSNLATLKARAPRRAYPARLALCLAPPRGDGTDVPDPYYGGDDGFGQVYALVFEACQRLLEQLNEDS